MEEGSSYMQYYRFVPGEIQVQKGYPIASNAQEMALLLFTAIYARMKSERDEAFSDADIYEEIGNLDWNQMSGKAIEWLSQI